jgi:isoleucyl-tRNA synthetase
VEVERTGVEDTARLFSDEDMKTFAIVSSFAWVDALGDTKIRQTDEELGIRVGVDHARGEKCPRCWQYTEAPDERGLCPRCSAVLRDREER